MRIITLGDLYNLGEHRRPATVPIHLGNMQSRAEEKLPPKITLLKDGIDTFKPAEIVIIQSVWKFIEVFREEQGQQTVYSIQILADHASEPEPERYDNCNQRIITLIGPSR